MLGQSRVFIVEEQDMTDQTIGVQGGAGLVLPGAIYTLNEFMAVSGMGKAALRKAAKKGLILRRCGLRTFVLAADFAAFLEKQPSERAKGSRVKISEQRTADPMGEADNGREFAG